MPKASSYRDLVRWNSGGLVPVIAGDHHTSAVLMVAWMNREALALSVNENRAADRSPSLFLSPPQRGRMANCRSRH